MQVYNTPPIDQITGWSTEAKIKFNVQWYIHTCIHQVLSVLHLSDNCLQPFSGPLSCHSSWAVNSGYFSYSGSLHGFSTLLFSGSCTSSHEISNGYRHLSGRLNMIVEDFEGTRITAPLIRLSDPLSSFSIRANFQKVLGFFSSCSSTTSP